MCHTEVRQLVNMVCILYMKCFFSHQLKIFFIFLLQKRLEEDLQLEETLEEGRFLWLEETLEERFSRLEQKHLKKKYFRNLKKHLKKEDFCDLNKHLKKEILQDFSLKNENFFRGKYKNI